MTTLAAPSNANANAGMMEQSNNDMEMDDMSIQSFCDNEEECEEIVDLLLNPFDEEDDHVGVVNVFDQENENDIVMMQDNLMTDEAAEQQKSLRQVSTGSKSNATVNSNSNNIVTPDGLTTLSTMMPSQKAGSEVLTNRMPVPLYLSCNPDHLNPYQVEMRRLIQLFEATPAYVEGQRIKGRNRAIVLGQVGVQCRFCGHVFPPQNRAKGSTYFPQKLTGIYQACQILSSTHLLGSCPNIPEATRQQLAERQKTSKASRTAGKDYWASTAEVLGVYEDEHGLRFQERIPTYDEMRARERARGITDRDFYKW